MTLIDLIREHWLFSVITIVAITAGTVWTIEYKLYVGQKDITIEQRDFALAQQKTDIADLKDEIGQLKTEIKDKDSLIEQLKKEIDKSRMIPTQGDNSTIIPEIKITSPKDGDKIPVNITVNGTISGELPNGRYMWIFINSQLNPNEWWPKGKHIQPKNGQWSTPVWVGGDTASNVGIAVVLVNENDDENLQDYGRTGDKTGNFPAMSLPYSAKIVANITVTKE